MSEVTVINPAHSLSLTLTTQCCDAWIQTQHNAAATYLDKADADFILTDKNMLFPCVAVHQIIKLTEHVMRLKLTCVRCHFQETGLFSEVTHNK